MHVHKQNLEVIIKCGDKNNYCVVGKNMLNLNSSHWHAFFSVMICLLIPSGLLLIKAVYTCLMMNIRMFHYKSLYRIPYVHTYIVHILPIVGFTLGHPNY